MPRTPPLARIDSRLLAVDNESNGGGDTLPAGVIGDVFGRGIDDRNDVAFNEASAVCWRPSRPIGGADGQASLSDASRGYWEGIDGGSLSGNHHSESAEVADPGRMGFMVKVFEVANRR